MTFELFPRWLTTDSVYPETYLRNNTLANATRSVAEEDVVFRIVEPFQELLAGDEPHCGPLQQAVLELFVAPNVCLWYVLVWPGAMIGEASKTYDVCVELGSPPRRRLSWGMGARFVAIVRVAVMNRKVNEGQ